MKTVKIIESLLLNEDGVQAKIKNGRTQKVHLQQGDLDGACAVYATFTTLILIGALKYSDITNEKKDKRTSIERLKKELLDTRGMHRDGNHFFHENEECLKELLDRNYSRHINVKHHKENVINVIKAQIEQDLPVLISLCFKGGAHALVAVGIECDKNDKPTKILCLDPGYPSPKFTYWNSVVDLTHQGGKYCFQNITDTGYSESVKLDDILVITKK